MTDINSLDIYMELDEGDLDGFTIVEEEPVEPDFELDDLDVEGHVDGLGQYLDRIGSIPLLSAEDEILLAQKMEQGGRTGRDARQKLIEHNLRLVISYAKKYNNDHGVDFDDLVQEGNIGLIAAVDGFDWRKGFRFSTYADQRIRYQLQAAIDAQGTRITAIPRSVSKTLRSVLSAESDLAQTLGRQPTVDELVEETGLSEDEVHEVLIIDNKELDGQPLQADWHNADGTSSEDSPLTLEESLDSGVNVENDVMASVLGDELEALLSGLPEKERLVLALRYGLMGEQPMTYGEIAEVIGYADRGGVRKVEQRALGRLRSKADALESFLNN